MADKIRECMLTTFDNPHSPFDDWDRWFSFDTRHGYQTSGLLARFVNFSDELSERDQAEAVEEAIDEILREDVTGTWIKVSREKDPDL